MRCAGDHRAGGAHDHQRLSPLYGLAVRGPLSAEEGASGSAIIVSGSGTFKLVQSTVSAPAGHGVELTGAGSDAAVISGVTFGAVRDSALHATDALGSWTVEGNLATSPRAPIGEHMSDQR